MRSKEIFENLIESIEWDNWKRPTFEDNEKIQYFDLCEVLYSKIEAILGAIYFEDDQHIDTLLAIQKLLSLLNEDKIKQIL